MAFFQEPPRLGNQFDDDPLLPSWIARASRRRAARSPPSCARSATSPSSTTASSSRDRPNEPVLTQWDAWGNRIDRIEVSPLWREAAGARRARTAWSPPATSARLGAHARTHQFAIVHVLGPSLDVYSCPLAMTDGAARTLLAQRQPGADRSLRAAAHHRAIRRAMWTSGQWMTERTGGSDVSQSETVARSDGDTWRLYGTKWFTSATTSKMALTLARPEGNPDGSRGLALFLVELRDGDGRLRNIQVNRLKDKLGTRKVPTAELTLDGTPATLVGAPSDGVRAITPMLSITRTWNAVCAVSGDAARARARARLRAPAHGVRRAARRQAAARRHARRRSRPSTRARSASRSARSSCSASLEHGARRARATSGWRARSCRSRS